LARRLQCRCVLQTDTFAPVREGEILAGKFCVERVLGAGGMGVVVAARHLQLDQRVAIKFLLPHALTNADAVERFAREARAAVRIKSEHVARVIDVGRLENDAPYIVMEYLEGEDLAWWIRQRGPLPIEQAVELVLQACEAIAEAHALGIVHRDLKPANLFCVRRANGLFSIKVLDFGISKLTVAPPSLGDSSQVAMTRTNAIIGSPLYMSPEQLRASRDVDARADVWSLGAVLFELVTGRPPFLAEDLPNLIIRIMTSDLVALRDLRPDAPPQLESVIARCLVKDREHRLASVAELAVALFDLAPGPRARASIDSIVRLVQVGSGSLPPPPNESNVPTHVTASTKTAWSPTGRGLPSGGRAKAIAIGTGGICVAVTAILILVFALGRTSRVRSPAASAATSSAWTLSSPSPPPSAAPPAPPAPSPSITDPSPNATPSNAPSARALGAAQTPQTKPTPNTTSPKAPPANTTHEKDIF
jgi:serine/threonine protein kinase